MDSFERRRFPIRFTLWYLAISSAYVALWILLAPKGFYDDFPTGPAEWVSALPPYNEHLERDYGAALLGLGTLAAYAAVVMDRRVVQGTALAFLVAYLPHLIFHATETQGLSTADNIGTLLGLTLPIVVALGLLAATRGPRDARSAPPPAASGEEPR